MVRAFDRRIASLKLVFEFLDEFYRSDDVSEVNRYSITFVIEELFTNMVKYNPNNSNEIQLRLLKDEKKITIDIIDYTETPFDMTKYNEVDTTLRIEERTPGGLGIHLTRKLMDDICYDFSDGRSKTTLTKYLEKKHV